MEEERRIKKINELLKTDTTNLKATQRHPFMLPEEVEPNSEEDNGHFDGHYGSLIRTI